jgi:hypothetical protein
VTCPSCGARLQLLTGRDGFGVVPVMAGDDSAGPVDGRPSVDRRVVANVYACPACEFVQAGAIGPAGDTLAAWARELERRGVADAVAELAGADDLAYYGRRYGRARSARELER